MENIALHYFKEISKIPRPSKKEEKIANYLCDFASKFELEYYRDLANNVLIKKSATIGRENEPPIALQGHTDMVCESINGYIHDFENESLELLEKDGFIFANNTTLGADDGAAVAIMLGILASNELSHPSIECLFTSDEEMGMGGAKSFDYSLIKSRRMINIDSEEEGVATISCAGGVRTHIDFNFTRIPLHGKVLKISITGLFGGHSGCDINENRQNAAKVLGNLLSWMYSKTFFNLISFQSGTKDNAIPRDGIAYIACENKDLIVELVNAYFDSFKTRLSEFDKKCKIRVDKPKQGECFDTMLNAKDTSRAIKLLSLLFYGVRSMSSTISNLPESSSNIGIVSTSEDAFHTVSLSRSCDDFILDEIEIAYDNIACMLDCECSHHDRYPGWNYSGNSEICDKYCESYKKITNKEPKVVAIHAGVECGLIKHAIPDLDVVSIGPDIYDIHTPKEKMSIDSLYRTWLVVCDMLAR